MINLDLKKLNVEDNRKAKRKKLFQYAAFPIVVLVLLACFFLRTTLFNFLFESTYNAGIYDDSLKAVGIVKFLNLFDPYLPYYDEGVALMQRDEYEGAETAFREAIYNNPPEHMQCKVFTNLALSIEYQAKKFNAEENYTEALSAITRSLSILRDSDCINSDNLASEAISRLESMREDIVAKLTPAPEDDRTVEIFDPSVYDDLTDKEVNDALNNFNNTDAARQYLNARDRDFKSYGKNKTPW